MLLCICTYNFVSLCLAGATVLFSVVAIWVAIWSSRQATKEVNRLINDTNHATRANIAVEIDKLEVEKFRLSMQILDLQAQKKQIAHEPRRTFYMADGDGVDAQIRLIDEQIEHCERLYKQMSLMQLNMQKTLNYFK